MSTPQGANRVAIRRANTEAVRQALARFPGIKNTEISELVSLSVCAVGRHVNRIRSEWINAPQPEDTST